MLLECSDVVDTDKVMETKKISFNTFWNNLKLKERLLKQKSRKNWVKEGDLNSKLFHVMLKSRLRKNDLSDVNTINGKVKSVDSVKSKVKRFFKYLFVEVSWKRHVLNDIEFKELFVMDRPSLEEETICEELKEVVWESDGDKCPGPDGVNFCFIKKC